MNAKNLLVCSFALIALCLGCIEREVAPSGTYTPPDTTQVPPPPTVEELVDARDGQIYKTVEIGNQTWMAKNLNYAIPETSTDSSWCYDNMPDSCAKYGRLYNWNAAMKACPSGWYLPTNEEWEDLISYVGGHELAGEKLKSASGDWIGGIGDGTDDYEFAALPGGHYYHDEGEFYGITHNGYWWSATAAESESCDAYHWRISYEYDYMLRNTNSKGYGFSVRCLQD